jgi:hypothetical protein
MNQVGIGDIQKNTSLLTSLTEAMEIFDKRKKQCVAIVYPVRSNTIVSKLAGKYRDRIKTDDLEQAKKEAMMMAMKEKYGRDH